MMLISMARPDSGPGNCTACAQTGEMRFFAPHIASSAGQQVIRDKVVSSVCSMWRSLSTPWSKASICTCRGGPCRTGDRS